MAGRFQDDEREEAMIKLFGLYKDESEGRSGVDAYLRLGESSIPFELKTTSRGSVTTVRDFGRDHIEKWKDKHWLIGVFGGAVEYYLYGSPVMMAPWIQEKEAYIRPDFMLATLAPNRLTKDDMFQVLGEKDIYTLEDARTLHKRQLRMQEYTARQDVLGGYSQDRMLEIFRDRARYLIERGSTLNNPHIPASYFVGWPQIRSDHAATLVRMVREALQ